MLKRHMVPLNISNKALKSEGYFPTPFVIRSKLYPHDTTLTGDSRSLTMALRLSIRAVVGLQQEALPVEVSYPPHPLIMSQTVQKLTITFSFANSNKSAKKPDTPQLL